VPTDRPRAVCVVTGSEIVRGERTDLNGPFLAREALRHGLEPARISIVGDDPAELEAAFGEALEADAVFVSGGLGPTHDDRTVEIVARTLGLGTHVDAGLEREIESVARAAAQRSGRDYAEFAHGTTKQATKPDGALSLGLAGTAPGLLLAREGDRVVVVLPGPPSELQRLWPNALASEPFRRLLARTRPPGRRAFRLFGVTESAVARALAEAGGDGDGVEATICARDYEIHVDLLVEPDAEQAADRLEHDFIGALDRYLYGRDERTVEEHVVELCRARGLTIGTAECCTAGLVAARLASAPGAAGVAAGGLVVGTAGLAERRLGVPAELTAEHGAASPEVAAALAQGARRELGVDVAIAVTELATPAGAEDGELGVVHLHAEGPDGGQGRAFTFSGDAAAIRPRAAAIALHLVRSLLG